MIFFYQSTATVLVTIAESISFCNSLLTTSPSHEHKIASNLAMRDLALKKFINKSSGVQLFIYLNE